MLLALYIIVTFVLMEGVAWATHKYIMHGILWSLHKDHHSREHKKHSFFELNDSFFIIFSIMAAASFISWSIWDIKVFLGTGVGISIYGAAYFLVHDVFIHQRLKILKRTNNSYLKAIRFAHKVHHKKLTKEDGSCFGMLWVPIKYYKMYQKEKTQNSSHTASADA